MNAKEARKKTEENIISSSSALRCEIDGQINSAINAKKFKAVIFKSIGTEEMSVVKEYYQSMGYKWETYSSRGIDDESSITISW